MPLALALWLAAALTAQQPSPGGVDVLAVSGPLDPLAVAFLTDGIEDALAERRQLVVIQLNSPVAVGDGRALAHLIDLVGDPPLPVVVWVGPAPAQADGGALALLSSAAIAGAAPGVTLGGAAVDEGSEQVDLVEPSIRQVLAALHSREVTVGGSTRVLDILSGMEVRFRKPGPWTRFLRLAVQPAAAFFFLVAGLAVVTFEFYALGPGVAAGTAGSSLLLAAYGVSVLPVRWWALALVLAGLGLLTGSFQQGTAAAVSGLGAGLLVAGGAGFVDGGPQLRVGWWGVGSTVAAALFFYLLALPAVARSRFSTQTIGRDHLIGRLGVVIAAMAPDGVVEVGGARWRAVVHREAGVKPGDPIRVTAVRGWSLEVEPAGPETR